MIRGCTPSFKITLRGINVSDLVEKYVTFVQEKTRVEKAGDDVKISEDGTAIIVSLSQEETLSFDSSKNVDMQLRATTVDGKVIASGIKRLSVGAILKDGVI